MEFRYKALDIRGIRSSGRIVADTEADARHALYERGLSPSEIKAVSGTAQVIPEEQGKPVKPVIDRAYLVSRFARSRKVPTVELVLFTKQFRTLYSSGIPLTDIFKVLKDQTGNKILADVCGDIERRIHEGHSLKTAFLAHPKVFNSLYCSMIDAGERSGAISAVLDRLTYLLQHEEKLKNSINSAVRYPKIVLGFMAGAFLILLNFVIPKFASVFASAHLELPLPTRVAIAMNHFFMDYWYIALALVTAVVMGWRYAMKTEEGLLWRDRISLRIPLLGALVQKAILARFAAIFSILQQSGVTILESMDILKETVDNSFFKSQFEAVKGMIRGGNSITDSLRHVKGFSPLAISLLNVGERSSHIEAMMDELRRHYDEEVELDVEKFTEYLGPVLIACLGVVVLFFALAIFLPMWDMAKLVQ